MLWRKMLNLKSIFFNLCFIGFIACKSNKSSSSNSAKIDSNTELSPVEEPNSKAQELSEPNQVAESEVVESENTASIYGKWRINTILKSGNRIDLPYKEWDMQLTFEEENENIGIKSPCNSGGCNYQLNGSEISIGDNCFFTEMYCEEEQKNTWERKLVEVLSDQTAVSSIDDVTLKLNGSAFSIELSRI